MKRTSTLLLIILNSSIFYSQIFSPRTQGFDTILRNDAGLGGDSFKSGFYETANPINFPTGAASWWHLLDVRHSKKDNNYAMQLSGSFFDQNLYYRKTNNDSAQLWSKILSENTLGNVGIGTDTPQFKLEVIGQIKSDNHTIKNYSPLLFLDRDSNSGGYIQGVQTRLSDGANNWFFGNLGADNFILKAGGFDSSNLLTVNRNGNASLEGKLEVKELKVTLTPTADFVFEDGYGLLKLEDVEKFILQNKHLPEIPSAKSMEKEGVNVGDFQIKLLQKIEELTLYVIEQNLKIKSLETKMNHNENSN